MKNARRILVGKSEMESTWEMQLEE